MNRRHELVLPPYAERIRLARERAGLSPDDLCEAMGINHEWYLDLECYDSELADNLSLRSIAIFCQRVHIRPIDLLAPDAAACELRRHYTATDVLAMIADHLVDASISLDEFGELIGWELSDISEGPACVDGWNLEELKDVCAGLGIPWLEAIPE